ncbi:MAG: P1 family peptidase [Thermoplasmata archaeon]|nr:P1 family peptidase [Thermoplasmata archaeon]
MAKQVPSSRSTVPGVRLGHAATATGSSGVSVLLFDHAAPTVVDVRGGASGTYDTASLSLDATFGGRWAVFFTGGSLFGLDAAGGIRDEILRQGGGQSVFANRNRIAQVSGAVLYDLPRTTWTRPDYRELGRRAARAAHPIVEGAGRVGAGSGARIGKYLGHGHSQRGALAVVVEPVGRGTRMAALAVVNAVGAVRDPSTGEWISGARDDAGRLVPPELSAPTPLTGTTLVAIVTNVSVPRSTLQRVAAFAHAGLARAVVPAHTTTDGDTVFVTSTGSDTRRRPTESRPGELGDRLGAVAERITVRAIVRAARESNRTSDRPGDGGTSPGGPGSGRSSSRSRPAGRAR